MRCWFGESVARRSLAQLAPRYMSSHPLPKWMAPGSFIRNFLHASNVESWGTRSKAGRTENEGQVKYRVPTMRARGGRNQESMFDLSLGVRHLTCPLIDPKPGKS